jgi:hypothetical protein
VKHAAHFESRRDAEKRGERTTAHALLWGARMKSKWMVWGIVATALVSMNARADDDAEECQPACRYGFDCVAGKCVPLRIASSDVSTKSDTPDDAREQPPKEKPESYKPSSIRAYAGFMTFAISNPYIPGLLSVFGGSVAIDYSPDEKHIFYIGTRFGAVADAGGVLATLDLDFGLRPRVELGKDNAFVFVVGGGLGVGVVAGGGLVAPTFHMPLRLGMGIDASAFTADIVAGPALYAAAGALGAFESVAEVGIRF